ncbi:MAG: tRNA (adenosine(37)-N6)-threonylcarbamoyltransferase complex dimerization subunit type 1 TsaB [Rickettsiaceae bacterium]
MVIVESALKKAKMTYRELDYLAVTVGPGSFTGIRVGLAAAKGIIHVTGAREIAITNFEAAHYRLGQQLAQFDVAIILINAYRDQQYIQAFNQNKAISAASLVDNKDVPTVIRSYSGTIACAGNGLIAVYDQIKDIKDLIILPRFPTIKAFHIARLADDKIELGQISAIEPLYIRPPDALPAKDR